MSEETYTPTNILLTGGCGFIGSNVLIHLVKKYPDYKFVNFDKLDYCANPENVKELEECPNYKFVKGNICTAELVLYVLDTENIDTIMHFAAQSHVDNSFGNSITFTENNILGTHVLLECAKVHGIKRFLHVSTDEVYGELAEDVAEATALEPTNPYAATKAGAEYLAKSYYRSFGLPVVITRGNNVYGPHQYPEKLIPKFIFLLESGKPCCLHGDGSNLRSFLHVFDVAKAFDHILHNGVVGEIYNVGTDFEISNLEVTRELLKIFGYADDEEKWIEYVKDRAFNDLRYNISNEKLRELGWEPEIDFETGLKMTVEWYLSHRDHWGDVDHVLKPHPTVLAHIEK